MWDFVKKIISKENIEIEKEYKMEIKNENIKTDEIMTHNNEENKEIFDEIEEEEDDDINNDDFENEDITEPFALYLLFSKSFKLNSRLLTQRIMSLKNDNVKVNDLFENEETNKIFAYVTINNERFKLVGLDMSIPSDLANYTLNNKKDNFDDMKKHNYHIIVFYEGENRNFNEVFEMFAKLAYGFISDNFLGIVNGYCWNSIKPLTIKKMFEDESCMHLSNTPAINIWRNIVTFKEKEYTWFATKGNNLYGIHEYAYKGTLDDYNKVHDMFERIFYYVYSTKTYFKPGSNFEVSSDIRVRFKELYESDSSLMGEDLGTLVVEIID